MERDGRAGHEREKKGEEGSGERLCLKRQEQTEREGERERRRATDNTQGCERRSGKRVYSGRVVEVRQRNKRNPIEWNTVGEDGEGPIVRLFPPLCSTISSRYPEIFESVFFKGAANWRRRDRVNRYSKRKGREEGRGREASLERDLEKRLTINDGIYD